MTIQIKESFDSRSVQKDIENYTTDVVYVVSGGPGELTDENQVANLVILSAPQSIDSLPLYGVSDVSRISDLFYKVTVTYKRNSQEEEDPDEENGQVIDYSLDTGGGSMHITNGFEVLETHGVPGDLGTALNVQEDGKVAGIEIESPVFNFSVTKRIPEAVFTPAMRNKIYENSGRVNEAEFTILGVTYLIRDLKFINASAHIAQQPDIEGDMWTVTYRFSAQKRLVNFVINKNITVAVKAGWDWMNVLYGKQADADIGRVIPVAYGANVVRVYEQVSFNGMGL